MPSQFVVVRLSEEEKSTLREAGNVKSIESLLAELKRAIIGTVPDAQSASDGSAGDKPRKATDAVKALAATDSVSIDRLTAAQSVLEHRREMVTALPDTPSKDDMLNRLDQGLTVIRESTQMIEAHR